MNVDVIISDRDILLHNYDTLDMIAIIKDAINQYGFDKYKNIIIDKYRNYSNCRTELMILGDAFTPDFYIGGV